MPYCTNCGGEVNQFAAHCPECGAPQNKNNSRPVQSSNQPDNGGFLWWMLGFCVPIAGLILYIIWKDERPRTAKSVGWGALWSVIFTVIIYVIYFVIIIGVIASNGSGVY